jgi:hypothetical protein
MCSLRLGCVIKSIDGFQIETLGRLQETGHIAVFLDPGPASLAQGLAE